EDRAVVLLGHVPNAGGETAVDVVVEAGDPRVPARLRPLARAVREDAVQDVERLPDLLRVRVRSEVDDPAPVPLAREHDPRVLVLDGDGDVRKGLVVPQPHVEGRPVPLDEVLLEVERLHLGARDDHLDVGDAIRQLADRGARVAALLEVAADARPQRLGLADVEHLPALVAEEVDARRGRERSQLLFDTVAHPVNLATAHGTATLTRLANARTLRCPCVGASAGSSSAFATDPGSSPLGAKARSWRQPQSSRNVTSFAAV